ncbi:uncharacterized protein LOC119076010 [Bradysia coprophila]|uniref:uncharacterized protein LOC119076010 n=1 Tax=Bradysia coprophila TaxID=38358 RepID=UPI00187D8AE8|nr:uncharacterized protein LOC119076010 [Bradysia coprophila]
MSSAIEMLLEQQKSIGEGMQEILKISNRQKVTRQTLPAVMKRLGALDKDWLLFKANDLKLKGNADMPHDHEYFMDNYYDTIATLVVSITEAISASVADVTGVNPRYDLIHRGNMATTRMFDDNGVDLRPPANGQPDSLVTPTDTTSGSTSSSDAIGNPNHEILNPNIREFFEQVSNGSFGQGDTDPQRGSSAMQKAIKNVEVALNECKMAITNGLNERKLRGMIAAANDRYETVKKLHAGLTSRDLDRYDPSDYYDFEQNHRDILVELTECLIDNTSHHDIGGSRKQKSIKMPQIEIPKFNGDYGKWTNFKDLFNQMMEQRDLTSTEKFMYLRGNLTGEPLALIESLQVTAGNYILAWDLLNDRYENPRHIIKSLLNKLLFNTERAKSNHSSSIKKRLDVFREGMYAVKIAAKTEEKLNDMIFHQLLLNTMDQPTVTLYEQNLDHERQPASTEVLMKFITKRFRALEYSIDDAVSRNGQQQVNNKNFAQRQKSTVLAAAATDNKVKLCNCKEKHSITKCPKFTKLTVEERFKLAKRAAVCLQCLKPGHMYKQCSGKPCFTCDKHHHTLLHFVRQETSAHLGSTIKNIGIDHVFLGTAIIHVMNANGIPIKMRALLDSGAQLNVMSERMLQKTGLSCTPANMQIIGLGEVLASSSKRTTINMASMHSNFTTSLEVFIMKTVTTCQPLKEVNVSDWKIPKAVQLADPAFNLPDKIDILIGAELFYRLLVNGLTKLGEGLPDLQNTVFGWIVIGRHLGLKSNQAFAGVGISNSDTTLQQQLERFWQVEEKGTTERGNMTDEERKCEILYERTTVRQSSGRFVVKLQLTKEPSLLGSSHDMAIRRFLSLERRFERDHQLKAEYCKFMKEYNDLGHMEKTTKPDQGEPCYLIPHHSVLNPESSTTKFRVVFDASAKTSSNISLNDIMSNGPMLQQDLFSIMVRFRTWLYVFSADISKMYRQILIAEEDRRWQMIVWRDDHTRKLEYYKLNTVTYGTKCASYLAIKSLQSLADMEAENYPLASIVAKRDFNVDDVMTGSNDLAEAIQCQAELIDMMKLGRFDLHKWCSNHSAILDQVPKSKRAVSLDINADVTETKALGMKWIPHSDIFSLKYEPKEHNKITKRTILSETAQLFDPLGLVNPVIVKAKIFMQELWKEDMDWDEVLAPEDQQRWIKYREQLPKVKDISVPRHVMIEDAVNVQLHTFSDASELAYGAAVYVRSVSKTGEVKVQLLCSKSRVAPAGKMKMSLPRLELCGATVASDLSNKVQSIIGIDVQDVKFWTRMEYYELEDDYRKQTYRLNNDTRPYYHIVMTSPG